MKQDCGGQRLFIKILQKDQTTAARRMCILQTQATPAALGQELPEKKEVQGLGWVTQSPAVHPTEPLCLHELGRVQWDYH